MVKTMAEIMAVVSAINVVLAVDVSWVFANPNDLPNDIPVNREMLPNDLRWPGVPQAGAKPGSPEAPNATTARVIKPELRMPWNVRLDVLREHESAKARRDAAQRMACDAEAFSRSGNS
jgi:hypothetical protein